MTFFILGGIALVVAFFLFFLEEPLKQERARLAATEHYSVKSLEELYNQVMTTQGADAFHQHCWVAGTIECDHPLIGPMSGKECVAYTYAVSVPEHDGPTHLLEHQEQCVPFWLRDDSGRILVDPTGANIAMRTTARRSEKDETGTYKSEEALEVGLHVYVRGTAMDSDGTPMIRQSTEDMEALYLISLRDRRAAAVSGIYNKLVMALAIGLGIGGVVLIALGIIFR